MLKKIQEENAINILMIGCGPHARRVYLPALKMLKKEFNINLKLVIELKECEQETKNTVNNYFTDVEFLFVEPFKDPDKLPSTIYAKLTKIAVKHRVTGIIIATDPINHMQYAKWALDNELHILMDKPISTKSNITNSVAQAQSLKTDVETLISKRNENCAFIINAQRRYIPGFQIVLEKIKEISTNFKMPITGMHSYHCDGQWRLPNEIITQKYHPYIGWGKISHSGYHLIDLISLYIRTSFRATNKNFDSLSVYSSFIRASGLLMQQTHKDYELIFGKEYDALENRDDETLARLFQENDEAEIDSSSIIRLQKANTPIANVSLNLLHNGFSRRHWILPGNDLYKGNGRVKHEYHNIEQGPLQNIQIHSYQSKDKHDQNNDDDYLVGGNNHFDIYIFRNAQITGGEALVKYSNADIVKLCGYDNQKLVTEIAKTQVVKEFIEVIAGVRKPKDVLSDIEDHLLSAKLMSLIYEAGIIKKEIEEKVDRI